MPCRVSSDVHEWINEDPAVPARNPVNPHYSDEQSGDSQREKKTPWSFTAACCWNLVADTECRRELVRSTSPGVEGGDHGTPPFGDYVSYLSKDSGTTAGGQFGWGGTPLKRNRGGPKVGSDGTETHRRGQSQKPA
jgi:hypothetical protein